MEKKAKIKNIYSLTPMQQGMLFHHLYQKDSKAYFQQICLSCHIPINLEIANDALNQLIDRYDILRTIFIYNKTDEAKQVVLESRTTKIQYEDISDRTKEEQEEHILLLKEMDRVKGFDLSKDLLLRVAIIKLGHEDYQIVISHHHIILDGWGLGIVFHDFIEIYHAIKEKRSIQLPEVPQYNEYVNWLVKQDTIQAENYWADCLADYENEVSLPKSTTEHVTDYMKEELSFSIGKTVTDQITSICKQYKITMNHFWLSIWGLILQKYNNTNDVVFGCVTSGRDIPLDQIEHMAGLFIHTIPMRITNKDKMKFHEFVTMVKETFVESQKYDYISLSRIQSNLNSSCINSLYIFENYPFRDTINANKDITADSFEQTNYDFNFVVLPSDNLQIKLKYNSLVYKKDMVLQLQEHIMELVQNIIINPESMLSQLSLLTQKEQMSMINDRKANRFDYNTQITIHELFEEQVRNKPEQTCLIYQDEHLTYQQVNEKANRIANQLRCLGVNQNTIVAMLMERSNEMIIGILAILKAGGAYLPIDPTYPKKRIQFMLDDSNANVILANVPVEASFDGVILDLSKDSFDEYDHNNLVNKNQSHDLAYIIYTSGTTGNPKGAMITHRSVINLCTNIKRLVYDSYDECLNVSLLAPYVFDASVKQIFPCLLCGQTLVIVPNEERFNGDKLVSYYVKNQVQISDGTPAHLSIIQDVLSQKKVAFPVKQFLIGGEELTLDLVLKMYAVLDDQNVIITNVYGPTECCDVATSYSITKQVAERIKKIPIGKPLHNVSIYLLDQSLSLVPQGGIGEIYIAGDGVGVGYYNREELTKERYLVNPFVEGEMMYKTGDLGRYDEDGNIEYYGRADQQVKIRGYRLELSEIKKQLLEIPNIKDAAITYDVGEDNEKFLCGFYVLHQAMEEKEIRLQLSRMLPGYMIPTFLLEVDVIPVTNNGKCDTKQLLARLYKENKVYVAPKSDLEIRVVDIVKQRLQVEKVGIYDDLFELGCDENMAMELLMDLRKEHILIKLSDLTKYPNIHEILEHMSFVEKENHEEEVEGDVLLTPIQQNFFERHLSNENWWNQAIMLSSKEGFQSNYVKDVFERLILHHDALRMKYEIKDGVRNQSLRKKEEKLFDFFEYDITKVAHPNEYMEQLATNIQESMNLSTGPLVKVGLFHQEHEDYLLIVIHHLVIDGISWRILIEDFNTAYTQLMNHQSIQLPEKTDSFKAWSQQLSTCANREDIKKEITDWNQILSASNISILVDSCGDTRTFLNQSTKSLTFSEEATKKLVRDIHRAFKTQTNEILLAILGLAMNQWTGNEQVIINMEGHGREDIIPDMNVSRTIGWFTSFYPILLDISLSGSLDVYLTSLKNRIRYIPNHGIGYSILSYYSDDEAARTFKTLYHPEISFNYLGQIQESANDNWFHMVDDYIGECTDPNNTSQYALNVIAKVVNSKLTITMKYQENEFSSQRIDELLHLIEDSANQVIDYCVNAIETMSGQNDCYVAPRNSYEKDLVEIWESVLNVSHISITDDFFLLGGDSIKAIKILSKANMKKLPISVKSILDLRTIENIMNDYYEQNHMTAEQEVAATKSDVIDLDRCKRTYNKDFDGTTFYPNYYGCMTGVILEKLKHERHTSLEPSFFTLGSGKFMISYGFVNGEGLHNKLQYRELPADMITDRINIFDELGTREVVRSFPTLEDGLAYCHEHLAMNELVMIAGTTYYLNYTPDYMLPEQVWRDRLSTHTDSFIDVSNRGVGRAHSFLLVDILDEGYLVYDSTFSYYGLLSVEDFNRSFAGLKNMKFLDGIYAQNTNRPYTISEYDMSHITWIDNKAIGLRVLKNTIDINTCDRYEDVNSNGYNFSFFYGVRAYKEIANILIEYRDTKEALLDLRNLICSCFGSYQYKFMFFRDFLIDLSKYVTIPEEYLAYCHKFIRFCEATCKEAGMIDESQIPAYIDQVVPLLNGMYRDQKEYFKNLKHLLYQES